MNEGLQGFKAEDDIMLSLHNDISGNFFNNSFEHISRPPLLRYFFLFQQETELSGSMRSCSASAVLFLLYNYILWEIQRPLKPCPHSGSE